MKRLQIQDLAAGYGNKQILSDINLSVNAGEMVALLGPSGCGKTTLLNVLCGFLPHSSGDIQLGDQSITGLSADKRNITMVFQSYALWPHLSVAQNVAYGLKVRKQPAQEIASKVKEFLTLVKLQGLENEKVTNLSGGQRQRVALARALIIQPDILVLDEPLSNLDAKVRLQVRHEIKSLQKEIGFSSLIVTHDQEEALVMADRIAVLNNGKIEQLGSCEEIFNQPKTPFVADFMGADNQLSVNRSGSSQIIYFRAEQALLEPGSHNTIEATLADQGLVVSGRVLQSAFFGNHYQVSLECDGQLLRAVHPCALEQGEQVLLKVPPSSLHIFNHSIPTN
ncbi:ABC transporter ATP-binding protein [Reinekea thalattae]|uniref:ABC transporter ATP-binding protein n=1 Tax=Reinekea thalattae TaxID=2593301 RepID=A0A5C8ZAT7_9GAMM|nr:ABC transporter ATP-binding protein [Reinekea thalattae]TXR53920.1 ABC transporter ATP-binding protein [Reinekea thalattae]